MSSKRFDEKSLSHQEILDVYFVAGFGAMGWVSPSAFADAHG